MTRTDRIRVVLAFAMVLLGIFIVVRAAFALAPLVGLIGLLLLALGAYRINQYRRFRSASGTR